MVDSAVAVTVTR